MHKKPNIIVCLCDQLRAFEVGCYGNKSIRTPNIDVLAQKGVRFEHAFSNNPVCTPARSVLLSGMYSRSCTGSLSNVAYTPPSDKRIRLTEPTLAEVLKKSGYQTSLIGKWHIHPNPSLVGFDYSLFPHHSHRYTGQTYFENNGSGFVVDGFAPEYEIKQVKHYIHQHKDNPFFLFYNISPPHMPLIDVPEKYRKMYLSERIPLRKNVWDKKGKMAYDENWFKIYLWDHIFYEKHLPYTENLPKGFNLRDITALYYGLTTWVDDLVAKLMQILKDEAMENDTILLFTSDHGDNLGSHCQFNKDSLIEESIRIPMVWHWPGRLKPNHQITQVISLVDVMPTLLGLVGLKVPKTVQGVDLSNVLLGEAGTVGENIAFIETYRNEIGVRTLSHLYGIDMQTQKEIFYDVSNDPFEQNNLLLSRKQTNIGRKLRRKILDWNNKTPWKLIKE